MVAFNNILYELDFVDSVVQETQINHPTGFTREEFVTTARSMTRFSRFSPLEFDLLFHFASLENKTGKFSYADFEKLLDPQYDQRGHQAGVVHESHLSKTSHFLSDSFFLEISTFPFLWPTRFWRQDFEAGLLFRAGVSCRSHWCYVRLPD